MHIAQQKMRQCEKVEHIEATAEKQNEGQYIVDGRGSAKAGKKEFMYSRRMKPPHQWNRGKRSIHLT